MITLFQLASGNNSLRYVDHKTGDQHMLKDLHLPVFPGERSLAFAYLGSDLASVRIFWALMKSKHSFAILSPSMNDALKLRLEEVYTPAFIYDPRRSSVFGYDSAEEADLSYFVSAKTDLFDIDSDVKILLSYAGGTGSTKLVKLSEAGLISNTLAVCDFLPIQREDVMPLTMPLHHAFGLSVFAGNSVKGGYVVCGGETFHGIGWMSYFNTYRFTCFNGVPKDFAELDLSVLESYADEGIKYFTLSGGRLQEDLVRKYADFAISRGLRFYITYGQPEAFGNMGFLAPERTLEKPSSIGKPVKDGRFIIDPVTNELCFAGSNVFGGYAVSKEDLAYFDLNIMVLTGDTAVLQDGFHYISGKKGRTAYVAGIRVNLDEMELIINAEFDLAVRCVSIEDRKLVIYSGSQGLSREQLIAGMSAYFDIPAASFHIVYVDELPSISEGSLKTVDQKEIHGS